MAPRNTAQKYDATHQATVLPAVRIRGIAKDVDHLMDLLRKRTGFVARTMAWEQVAMGVAEIRELARCAATLASELKRDINTTVPPVDVGTVIKHAQTLLRTVAGADVALEYRLSADQAYVNVSAAALEQIMLNLVTNAQTAGADTVCVSTEVESFIEAGASESGANRLVTLRVEDNGKGISHEALLRAGSQRAAGETPDWFRTGLGAVDSIVQTAGGSMEFSPKNTSGLSARVKIPMTTQRICTHESANDAARST